MSKRPQLLVMTGPLAGKRFPVPPGGLRLGRSSSNDVHVPDEELSRNHCLFEQAGDDGIHVIDLASANGTYVNSEPLGADAKRLNYGDIIEAGTTVLKVVDEDTPSALVPPPGTSASGGSASASSAYSASAGAVSPSSPSVDLGLDGVKGSELVAGAAASPAARKRNAIANVLWGVVALSVATLIALILLVPPSQPPSPRPTPAGDAAGAPVTELFYEKVEADSSRIFRYCMTVDSSGLLRVAYDDVPGENRHVDKSTRLSEAAMKRIAEIFQTKGWDALDAAYTGASAEEENALRSLRIKTLAGSRVREVLVENSQEPAAFQAVREALETFSRNELGVWALQYSTEQLIELSKESARVADMKWEERDVETGNLAAAIAAYSEAVFYLDTVKPKPPAYATLKDKLHRANAELDRRYKDQRFNVDKAINLKDWQAAQRELRVLLELVTDQNDERHAEARAKLVDVERRLGGGKGKGGAK